MERRPVREGMRVYTRDGHYAGTVIGVGEERFQVEKGVLTPHDYLVNVDDIRWRSDQEIELKLTRDELREYHPDAGSNLPPRHGDDSREPLHSRGW